MGIFRLIILGLLIWLGFRLYKRFFAKKSVASDNKARIADNMVRCKHCGIHVPENEALRKGEDFYCCKNHLDPDDHH